MEKVLRQKEDVTSKQDPNILSSNELNIREDEYLNQINAFYQGNIQHFHKIMLTSYFNIYFIQPVLNYLFWNMLLLIIFHT